MIPTELIGAYRKKGIPEKIMFVKKAENKKIVLQVAERVQHARRHTHINVGIHARGIGDRILHA